MSLPRVTLTVFFTLFFIHVLAIFRNWYLFIPSLDIPMHLLGGFFSGLLFLCLYQIFPKLFGHHQPLGLAVTLLGFVMLIGVGWEFFEFGFDYLNDTAGWSLLKSQVSLADTMGDLFLDFLGGWLAFLTRRLYAQS